MQWNRLGEGTGKEGRGEQKRAKRARKTVKNRNFWPFFWWEEVDLKRVKRQKRRKGGHWTEFLMVETGILTFQYVIFMFFWGKIWGNAFFNIWLSDLLSRGIHRWIWCKLVRGEFLANVPSRVAQHFRARRIPGIALRKCRASRRDGVQAGIVWKECVKEGWKILLPE